MKGHLFNMIRLGAHMSIAGGLHLSLERGESIGCRAIQLFTKSSNQWKARPLKENEIEEFFFLRKKYNISPLVAHDSYLINLASPVNDLWEKSVNAFRIEIERCKILNIPYLVMHPGSHTGSGTEAGIKRICSALNLLLKDYGNSGFPVICLETTAGQGTGIGSSFEEIREIYENTEVKSRIGVCLDTCHIFAAGYDITTKNKYEETFSLFDEIIGLDKLKVIHVNDSKKPLGSRVDRHAHIGKGFIGLDGFGFLVNDPRLNHLPYILETPKGPDLKEDVENIKILRNLMKISY